ncbi:MAG: type II toxin-antitoxin system HigB family toxin [Cyclobacteriaceae bacterium]|nr:type II toxin-antitoxin system HigB family toxin [Cyclobacteriaceae bacterium]
MRVHLIKKQSIEDFVLKNARSKTSFAIWLLIIRKANWSKPDDIVSTFSNADILGKGSKRVVFNIGGNNYRLIASYYFGKTKIHLFVNWIGSHAEYTQLCNEGKQYTISIY